MREARATYSTGILRKAPKTNYALVDVVNLSAHAARSVTVQVFDWSSGSPVALKVSPCDARICTVRVGPRRSVFLFANVSRVQFKYEVRVTQSPDRRLITNVTGVTGSPFAPQVGETVLQLQLVKLGSTRRGKGGVSRQR
ncbi:hypothetical protein [Cohnella fermenti]|uniref:Uncharacterized protein n=1 Tax=Cohnella fermenti TaxID=2565925 RepID=A0A4S4C924_9BACL|nr:hypothetical protein [Cohnella fermenti]THF84552.1 hypothetical protein E6C55_00785 [Cohnella fermenti]